LLFAWETLFPDMGPLPVTSHTRAMWTLHINGGRSHERLTSPKRVAVTHLFAEFSKACNCSAF